MTKMTMTGILISSICPSPLGGEEKGEGRFLIWTFGNLNFLGIWNLDIGI